MNKSVNNYVYLQQYKPINLRYENQIKDGSDCLALDVGDVLELLPN